MKGQKKKEAEKSRGQKGLATRVDFREIKSRARYKSRELETCIGRVSGSQLLEKKDPYS